MRILRRALQFPRQLGLQLAIDEVFRPMCREVQLVVGQFLVVRRQVTFPQAMGTIDAGGRLVTTVGHMPVSIPAVMLALAL